MKYIKNFEKLILSYLPWEILINIKILLKNKYWKITGKKDVYYWKILSPNKSSKIYHSDNISVVTLNFNTNTVRNLLFLIRLYYINLYISFIGYMFLFLFLIYILPLIYLL